MKSVPGMLDGAMAVRFYHSLNGPFPIEVGAAVPGSSMSAIIKPAAGLAGLDPMSEEDLGVSLLEAEAIGLVARKACEQLNAFLAGRRVTCTSSTEVEAIGHLFEACAVEREFHLAPLDAAARKLSGVLPVDQYPETIARDLFILAQPIEARRTR